MHIGDVTGTNMHMHTAGGHGIEDIQGYLSFLYFTGQ